MSVTNWLVRHAQTSVGALGTLFRNPLGTALQVTVIGIALALPAGLNVLVQTARQVAGGWQEIRNFSVYLSPGLPPEQAMALAHELGLSPVVAAVRVITAEQAMAELRADPGFGGVADALETNPLPHTLVVRPTEAASPAEIQALADDARRKPGVDLVKLDTEWLARLNALLDVARRAVWIAAVLLVGAVLVIVGNTIRLDIQNRAGEIEVAKLVGATDAFVRRPFLYLGLWYGLFGGALALLLLAASLWALSSPVARLMGLYGSAARLGGLDVGTALAVLGGGVVVGCGGAWTAVARHLAAIQPRV